MKRVLLAKLEDSCLIVQEDCLALIQEVLLRHGLEHLTFISVLGNKTRDLSPVCLSALDYFGCLEIDQEALEEEDEHGIGRRNTQGIFLLPSYHYTTAYAMHAPDSCSFPVTVGVFGLVINASRASVVEYVLMMNYVMLICSHTVFLNDPQKPLPSPELSWTYLHRFLVTDSMDSKMASVIYTANYQKEECDRAEEGIEDMKNAGCSIDIVPRKSIHVILYPTREDIVEDIFRILQERNKEMISVSAIKIQHSLSQICTCALNRCNEAYRNRPNKVLPGFLDEIAQEVKSLPEVEMKFRHLLEIRFDIESKFSSESDRNFREDLRKFYDVTTLLHCLAPFNHDMISAIANAFEPEVLEFEDKLFVDTWPHRVFVEELGIRLKKIEKDFRNCVWTEETTDAFIAHLPEMYGSGIEDLDFDTRQGISVNVSSDGIIWRFPPTYDFVLKGFLPPFGSTQALTSRLQYTVSKRLYHHYEGIKSAIHELRAVSSYLKEAFLNHLLHPLDFPIPDQNFQNAIKTTLPGTYWQTIQEFLEQLVSAKYQEMLSVFKECQTFIQRELSLARFEERQVREESTIQFQRQVKF